MTNAAPTPVRAIFGGLVAGAIGTVAMDALLFTRYRRGGGRTGFAPWELSSELKGWDDTPTPAQVGKRLVEGLVDLELPREYAAYDLAADAAGGADHCGGHRVSFGG
jgi:hypothetical protein